MPSTTTGQSSRTVVGSLRRIRYRRGLIRRPVTMPAVVSTVWVSPARPFSKPYRQMQRAPLPHISPMLPSEL